MVLQKLLQELHRLLPRDVGPEVAVVAEQLVKPVHSRGGREAGRVVPEVVSVLPEGHTSPEQTGHLIPLQEETGQSLFIGPGACPELVQALQLLWVAVRPGPVKLIQ